MAAGTMSVSDMFIALQGVLTADQDIREVGAGPGRRGAGCAAVRRLAWPGLAWPDGAVCWQEIRKVVQALEQTAREILTLLQGVHQGAGFQDSECRGAACSLPRGSGEKSSRGKGRHPRSARAPLSRGPGFQSVSVARGLLGAAGGGGGRQLGGFEPDE